MKLFAAIVMTFIVSGVANAGCIQSYSSKASSDIARYKSMLKQGQLAFDEYNDLVRGSISLVRMGAINCEAQGQAELNQEQTDQLILKLLLEKKH